MAAIKGRDTKPEMRVRLLLHALGYRYRLHRKDLPGKPDIVLPKYRTAIFVHGCFWHCHDCRYGRVTPATHKEFWTAKRMGNVTRDRKKREELEDAGWRIETIWECDTRDQDRLRELLKKMLGRMK